MGDLTETELEALDVGTSLFGWSDRETALRHLAPVVESILAEREAALIGRCEEAVEALRSVPVDVLYNAGITDAKRVVRAALAPDTTEAGS